MDLKDDTLCWHTKHNNSGWSQSLREEDKKGTLGIKF